MGGACAYTHARTYICVYNFAQLVHLNQDRGKATAGNRCGRALGREARRQQSIAVGGHLGERQGDSSQSRWAGTRDRGKATKVNRGGWVLGREARRQQSIAVGGYSGERRGGGSQLRWAGTWRRGKAAV